MMWAINLDEDTVPLDQYVSTEEAISSEMVHYMGYTQTAEHKSYITLVLSTHAGLHILLESLQHKQMSQP